MSVEPWNRQLSRPVNESGPNAVMQSTIMPREPLPLRGFISAVGNAPTQSVGAPSSAATHAMPPVIQSITPAARKTPMPTSMATR